MTYSWSDEFINDIDYEFNPQKSLCWDNTCTCDKNGRYPQKLFEVKPNDQIFNLHHYLHVEMMRYQLRAM